LIYSLLADTVVTIHLFFVGFVVLGGLAVWYWPRMSWVHLPAVAWAIWIELSGGICPLTPLENWLRLRAGSARYQGDFIDRYLLPLMYPENLTRDDQLVLGYLVILVNIAAYGWLLSRRNRNEPI